VPWFPESLEKTIQVMDPYSGVMTGVPKVSHQFAPAFSRQQAVQ